MIIQLAMDDSAGWNEGDHPRDGTGKFTKGGAVTASLAKSGWKKVSESKTHTVYSVSGYKSDGNQISVNKETGEWAGTTHNQWFEGTGKGDLPSHLQAGGDGTGGGKASSSGTLGQITGPQPGEFTEKQQDYIVNSHVGKLILAAGFKKTKSADGTLEYKHPSGAKVMIHPPAPDKKSSSDWTHFAGGDDPFGYKGSGVAIGKILGQAVAKAEAKPTAAPATSAPADKSTAPSEPVPSYISASVAEKIKQHAGEGGGINLKSALMTGEGYGKPSSEGPIFTFKKDNGATVEIDVKSGKWLAKTPGHMTKEGEGGAALMQLLSGQPAILKKGDPQPWKNSSATTLVPDSPEVAAKKAAEQKAQAEAHAAEQKLAGQASATQTMLGNAAPDPTPKEKSAVAKYTGSAYHAWNDKLRHDPDFHDEATKNVDSYLHRSEFPEDVTVFRKVSGDYSKILKSILITGTKFVDHGYISTSTHKGTWSGDMQWVITVKKGQKGASVKKLSHYSGENEVLLPRGSAFVVKSFDRKTGVAHVELDQSHIEHKWKSA